MSTFDVLSPDGSPIFLANLPNARDGKARLHHEFVRNEDELQKFLSNYDHPGRASYWTVARLADLPPGEPLVGVPGSWRRKDNVVGTHWIWAEVDCKDHPDIPSEEIKRRLLESTRPAPSIVISSGHGFHVYWKLAQRLAASPGEGQRRAEELLRLACQHIGGDAQVAEVARLMRLPGSHNSRVIGERLPVTFEVLALERKYGPGELENAWLKAAPILPAPQARTGTQVNVPKTSAARASVGVLDVEEALSAIAPGNINDTRTRVAAALISRGQRIEDVVDIVLTRMKEVLGDETKGWDWEAERRELIWSCYRLINKDMKTGRDLSHCLPDPMYEKWRSILEDGGQPTISINRAGFYVRGAGTTETARAENMPQADGNVLRLVSSQPDIAQPRKEPTGRFPKIFSSSEFTAGFVPPDYLIDGVLQRRFLYSLTGATGDGKTCVMLLIAAFVALGRLLCGHAVEQGRILVLAGENPDDVRMRWIAMGEHFGFDPETIGVDFLPGIFSIEAMKRAIERLAQDRGYEYAAIMVDTSAAYFSGSEENSNVQLGNHARSLRSLVDIAGGPCVIVSCHPTKAADYDNLLPRGGGAFPAEVDGNLICRKAGGEHVSEMHWHGKFRGPDFNAMAFELRGVTSTKLVDSKGKPIPTILAVPLDEHGYSNKRKESREQEDALLILLGEGGDTSLYRLAERAGWFGQNGEPLKTKAHRVITRLRDDGLVKNERGDWVLTEAGKKACARAMGRHNR